MEYAVGKTGRIIAARLFEGEDLYESIEQITQKENIKSVVVGPKLHIHTAIGKGENSLVGCPRGGAKTFLVLEITIIEFEGINASRKLDPEKGLNLLRFE